jgi:hypothetical protein
MGQVCSAEWQHDDVVGCLRLKRLHSAQSVPDVAILLPRNWAHIRPRLGPSSYAMEQLVVSSDSHLCQQESFIRRRLYWHDNCLATAFDASPRRLKTAIAVPINRYFVLSKSKLLWLQ